MGNRYSFGYFKVLTQEEYNNMLSGNVVPINLEGSATNLIRYYPMLSSCTPNYENASYSIGINEKSKTEIGNKTPNIKKRVTYGMDKLTLKIEYTDFLNNDLENYLKDLNGVKIIKINNDKNEIYVEYDSNIISLRL